MEVQGSQPNQPSPAYRRYLEARRDLFLANRERVRSGREDRLSEALETREARAREAQEAASQRESERTERRDRIELSAFEDRSPAADPTRRERVSELRRLYSDGELFTPERLERSAEGILSSGSDDE